MKEQNSSPFPTNDCSALLVLTSVIINVSGIGVFNVEFDDDDIIALAESYMAQLEHPKMVSQGPVKF